jgi:hypothetical protein
MVAAGAWRATRPEVSGHHGYRINALVSSKDVVAEIAAINAGLMSRLALKAALPSLKALRRLIGKVYLEFESSIKRELLAGAGPKRSQLISATVQDDVGAASRDQLFDAALHCGGYRYGSNHAQAG